MSSFGIYNPAVTFPDASVIDSIFPAPANCLGMGFLGGTLPESIVNLIDPDRPLAAVGTPSIFEGYAACDPANCFDTGVITLTGDFTFAVVANLPLSAGAGIMMGNLRSGTGYNNGDGLAQVVNGDVVRGYFGFGVNTSVSAAGLTHARHRLMVQRLSGMTGRVRIYDDGNESTSTPPAARSATAVSVTSRNASTRAIRVGAAHDTSSTFNGGMNVAWWGLWSRSISDTEIEQQLRPFLSVALEAALDAAV